MGLIGFKGAPDAHGEVEVGYGIAPQFQGQGYTTEALRGLCAWALSTPRLPGREGQTVLNPASNRILYKAGAQIVDAREGRMEWKIYRLGFQPPGGAEVS